MTKDFIHAAFKPVLASDFSGAIFLGLWLVRDMKNYQLACGKVQMIRSGCYFVIHGKG